MDLNIFSSEGSLYRLAEWITRLVFLNLLWILFSFLGLGILGIMPATVALFGVINKLLEEQENVRIFREFWSLYKKYFIRSNLIGLIMLIIGIILYIDLDYFKSRAAWYDRVIVYFLYILIIFYLLDFFYIFPIVLKYDIKIRYIIKNAFSFVFLTPVETFQIIIGIFVIAIFFYFLPSLLPFLGISLPVFWITRISMKSIRTVESKVINYQNKKHE